MEEILASIRRIISEDTEPAEPSKPEHLEIAGEKGEDPLGPDGEVDPAEVIDLGPDRSKGRPENRQVREARA